MPADSVIGLQIETSVSSETARVEDRVDARVTRDVTVDGRVAIPAGARVRGAVTLVDRGGKVKDRSRLGVRFHTLVLADGTTHGDPDRRGLPRRRFAGAGERRENRRRRNRRRDPRRDHGRRSRGRDRRLDGAAGGTAAVMAGIRKAAALPAGTSVTVRVLSPVTVTVEN